MWWDYCVSVLFGVDEKDGHAGHGVLGRDELMRAAEEEHASVVWSLFFMDVHWMWHETLSTF